MCMLRECEEKEGQGTKRDKGQNILKNNSSLVTFVPYWSHKKTARD